MVSDRDRHIIAFGCDTEANPGVQDPLAITIFLQESLTDWASTATNTAGELRLGSGSEIVTALETRQQILVFTDDDSVFNAVSWTTVYFWCKLFV